MKLLKWLVFRGAHIINIRMPFFSFNAEQSNRKAIISMILRNEKGTLSKVLSLVSVKQVNVLAINQTIPINGIANVALTLDISDLEIGIQSLVSLIEAMPMVEKARFGSCRIMRRVLSFIFGTVLYHCLCCV